MSDIRIKDIGKDISLAQIEIVMTDDKPEMVSEPNSYIIVNLHPSEGIHWVLVIRRENCPMYYFDSFGVKTPPLFLEEYVDLGSNERIQQYDESYCGAYCLYMIYLFDRGFRIKSALNILVNQCKYPGIYNECFCLGCSKIMMRLVLMIKIMLMLMIKIMLKIKIILMLMIMINLMIKIILMLMIMIMSLIMIMIMIMLMIVVMTLIMLMIKIMIMIMIMMMINLYIYWMKNMVKHGWSLIKSSNLITIVLLTVSL